MLATQLPLDSFSEGTVRGIWVRTGAREFAQAQ